MRVTLCPEVDLEETSGVRHRLKVGDVRAWATPWRASDVALEERQRDAAYDAAYEGCKLPIRLMML